MEKERCYTLISTDGSVDVKKLKRKATLEELQNWVDGYIQIIQLTKKQWAVVDEEGAINGKERNRGLTVEHNKVWGPLHGTVVLLPEGCQG